MRYVIRIAIAFNESHLNQLLNGVAKCSHLAWIILKVKLLSARNDGESAVVRDGIDRADAIGSGNQDLDCFRKQLVAIRENRRARAGDQSQQYCRQRFDSVFVLLRGWKFPFGDEAMHFVTKLLEFGLSESTRKFSFRMNVCVTRYAGGNQILWLV